MKKYLIVLMILFILMGVFNMDILGRSMTDIQRRMVEQTNYRINVVKGVVATININGTYGCYIAGETVIYPNIPTFSRNPKLEIGDKVTIEFINGCRKTPCILAPEDIREVPDTTLPVVSGYIFIVCDNGAGTYYIKSYDDNGNLIDTWIIEATENVGNAMAVDADGNVYTITQDQHNIKKRDSGGVLTVTKNEANFLYNIAIAPDGYIYTQEYDGGWNAKIVKRNAGDLTTADTLNMGNSDTYYGMAIDSDSNFYLINGSTHNYEKWTWGGFVMSYATTHFNLSSLGVTGLVLANIHWLNHGIYLPKTLVAAETDVELEDLTSPGAVGSKGDNFLFTGYDAASMLVLGKYDISLVKVWTVVVPGSISFGYGSIAAYPF